MLLVYGIPNCDMVRKALAWLKAHGMVHEFRNIRTEPLDPALLARWADEVGWEALLNRVGTTFRKLDAGDRADIDRPKALALMQAHPTLVRRPVAEGGGRLLVGFRPERYEEAFGTCGN